ncbi:hypothetical protein SNOG_10087 [Parastagonospora nodorum SN15]|uniref:Uncharacterized protein n=1 Tax=Phaeosphaeria nodorum (strain SN15 / ATCC MYA-4574 / FGSC 10173) TaxID=321614 RepID=Q0UDS7_PHANO|nr:hypothetical protein SNOG_10087 [Parastagonospora nodorum SN15]EAT82422.1 hypothetical protein SNOG_10087 [Parastagonospora nodorum SN15]
MSKRLLFFTDTQVASHEARGLLDSVGLHQLRGNVHAWVSPIRWDPGESHAIIEQHSTRYLSFEKDALDAITGIWGMFEKHNPDFRHIFGIPFCTRPLRPSCVYPSLLWAHVSPAVRRLEFTSWSFLGWKGAVESKHFGQKPDSYEGMIEVSENNQWHPLESLLKTTTEQFYSITAKMSPLLKMNAIAVEFGLEFITWNVSDHDVHDGF